jgi:hypothetical protein
MAKTTGAYLSQAQPLAGAVLAQCQQVGRAELTRLRDVIAPLADWRVPAVAEHAAALVELLDRMARLAD